MCIWVQLSPRASAHHRPQRLAVLTAWCKHASFKLRVRPRSFDLYFEGKTQRTHTGTWVGIVLWCKRMFVCIANDVTVMLCTFYFLWLWTSAVTVLKRSPNQSSLRGRVKNLKQERKKERKKGQQLHNFWWNGYILRSTLKCLNCLTWTLLWLSNNNNNENKTVTAVN